MRSTRMFRFTALAVVFSLSPAVLGSEHQPGEVLVKFKKGIFRSRAAMSSLYQELGVRSVRHFSGLMKGIEQLKLEDGVRVEDAINALEKSKFVEYAQPNYILRMPRKVAAHPAPSLEREPCPIPGFPWPPGCEDPETPPTPERPELLDAPADVVPPVIDPDLSKAYGLEKVQATQAWKVWGGSKDFIVADIDTGIDYNHEDLAFNVWRNPNPSPDKQDIVGYDFIHNDGLPYDDQSHGTHTGGTIAAAGGNGRAISGVAQRVSLMAVKFLSAEGSGTTADAIRSIDYAVEHGAKVLSNSWGGPGDEDNKLLYDAIERAREKDVLFIAAAGNDGANNDGRDPSYPAAFDNDNLIAVAATDKIDGLAFFSNYGKKTTHLGAPGVNVYSTKPGNVYTQESGTSMACPHVAGAAALLWSRHPEWDYKKVKKVLLDNVDKVPSLQGKTVTGGRLNILKALRSTE